MTNIKSSPANAVAGWPEASTARKMIAPIIAHGSQPLGKFKWTLFMVEGNYHRVRTLSICDCYPLGYGKGILLYLEKGKAKND